MVSTCVPIAFEARRRFGILRASAAVPGRQHYPAETAPPLRRSSSIAV
jgi:hypothetical protein